MGSQIVDGLVVQLGRITTNPGGFTGDDEPSRPIQQGATGFIKVFQNIEQRIQLNTAKEGTNELSNPIEQQTGATFAIPTVVDNDAIIELFILASEGGPGDAYEGPLVQNTFGTRSFLFPLGASDSPQPMQQFFLTSNVPTSKPVELVPRITNTIQFTQFDFIDLIFPPCNSIKNPVDVNILWRIKDFGFEFNVETLIFTVQGSPVQDRPEFTTTAIIGGLQLDFNPPDDFDFEEEVEITLEIEDTAVPPNFIFFRCKWSTVPDTRAPSILNLEPACDSTDVSTTATVEFDVIDIGDGVDSDSLRLSIEGITVCSGVTLDPIPSGIHVTYEHPQAPFRFGAFVTVGIEVADLSPLQNSTLFVCCFETEESRGPLFLNFDPESCESFVDNTTGLTFEVYGDVDGVDITTLEVRVDNVLRRVFVNPRILRSE